MSEKFEFKVVNAKLYGIYKKPYYYFREGCYLQKFYMKGEISNSLHEIRITEQNASESDAKEGNKLFVDNILSLATENDIKNTQTASFNYDLGDPKDFILTGGVPIKQLFLDDKLIAIGSSDCMKWIPTNNYTLNIENIEEFKDEYRKEAVKRYIIRNAGLLKERLIPLLVVMNNLEPYIDNEKIKDKIIEFKSFFSTKEVEEYINSLINY